MDISHLDWPALCEQVADDLRTRWPWLPISSDGEGWAASVRIETDATHASIVLRAGPRSSRAWFPAPTLGKTSCAGSDPRRARSMALELLAICDALDVAMSGLSGVGVWPDGEVPCSRCGGRGWCRTEGDTCKHCEGRGTLAPQDGDR